MRPVLMLILIAMMIDIRLSFGRRPVLMLILMAMMIDLLQKLVSFLGRDRVYAKTLVASGRNVRPKTWIAMIPVRFSRFLTALVFDGVKMGASVALKCEAGSYRDAVGGASCTACPGGHACRLSDGPTIDCQSLKDTQAR